MIENTQFKIWIECKYVFKSVRVGEKANLNWTTKEKLQRYRDFERNSKDPVYVAIGVGGEPYSPERLFPAPLDELPYESLFESVYTKFERPTDAIVKINCTLLQSSNPVSRLSRYRYAYPRGHTVFDPLPDRHRCHIVAMVRRAHVNSHPRVDAARARPLIVQYHDGRVLPGHVPSTESKIYTENAVVRT